MAKKFLVSIALTVGSAAAPALTFGADAASGLYQIGTNNIGLSIGGVKALNVDGGGLTVDKSVTIGTTGNYTAGSLYSDSNWGMIFRAKAASPAIAEFMWANSAGGELMRLSSAGFSFTNNPLLIQHSTADYGPQFTASHIGNTVASAGYFIGRRARAGGTAVASGDVLGSLLFQGHDGTVYRNGPYIAGVVDGAVSSGVMPAALSIVVGSAERIRIQSDGKTLINKATGDAYAGLFQIGYSAAVISPGTGNTAMFSVGSVTAYAAPDYNLLAMYHHGTTEVGNLDYCPSVAKANVAELIAVNCTGLVITTNSGFVAIGAAAAERARFASDGVVTLGGLVAAPALKITPSVSQTGGINIIGGTATIPATITTTAGGGAIRIGVKGSAPELVVSATDGGAEGGQLTLEGAAANASVVFDNYAGALRIMNTGVAGSELLVLGTTGNSVFGNATGRDGLLYVDIKNVFATGVSTGSILRLISRNAANTGDVAANIVKYRSGSFYIGNDETDTTHGVINIGTASATQVQIKVKASADRVLTLVGGKASDGSIATVGTNAGSLGFGPSISIFAMDLANRLQVQGAASGSPVYVYAVGDGTDANISLFLGSKGAGGIHLATNGAATNQVTIKHNANADRQLLLQGGYSISGDGLTNSPSIDTSAGDLLIKVAGTAIAKFSTQLDVYGGVVSYGSIYAESELRAHFSTTTPTGSSPAIVMRMGATGPYLGFCSGAPTVTGWPSGSIVFRTDGGASTRMYSTNGTSWYAMTSA